MEATEIYKQIAMLNGGAKIDVVCQDAFEHMVQMPDNSVDILLTYPPYGIDIDKNAISIGGVTCGASVTGFKYEDTAEDSIKRYEVLATESSRFVNPTGHGYALLPRALPTL